MDAEVQQRAARIVNLLNSTERAMKYMTIVQDEALIESLRREFELHKKQPVVMKVGNSVCTCRTCCFLMGITCIRDMINASVAMLQDITDLLPDGPGEESNDCA